MDNSNLKNIPIADTLDLESTSVYCEDDKHDKYDKKDKHGKHGKIGKFDSVNIGAVKSDSAAVLSVCGDVLIDNNLQINKHVDCASLTTDNLIAVNGVVQNLTVHNLSIHNNIKYLEGPIDYYVSDKSLKTIYANPRWGNINIFLPETFGSSALLIKDISLLLNNCSKYNIYITCTSTNIEHYSNGRLEINTGGTYILNTCGGNVKYSFFQGTELIPSCWLIESQFIGNRRAI